MKRAIMFWLKDQITELEEQEKAALGSRADKLSTMIQTLEMVNDFVKKHKNGNCKK